MRHPIPVIGDLTNQEKQEWLAALNQTMPDETFVELDDLEPSEREAVDFAIVANPDPTELNKLPNLVWVQSLWAGVEKLVAEHSNTSFKIVRLTDPALADTMAEAALTWSLFLHRNMHRYQTFQQETTWQQLPYVPPEQRTIAILGLGLLGKRCCERLLANGFHVVGWSKNPKTIEGVQSYSGSDSIRAVLNQAEIIINLLPSTSETHHLLNKKAFQQCSKNVRLINFGRGSTIDDNALIEALETGTVEHAVLDVFAEEPLPKSHPFWSHANVTVLPHISASTRLDTASLVVRNNLSKYRADGTVPPAVDMSRGY
jgi:glyoxylate/hydroxypyruvate reductase A